MRIKPSGTAVYHVITRIVAGEMLLDERAKEVLRKMLWRVAEFSGVEILSYCVMTNHLHVLVRVPEGKHEDLPDAVLIKRYASIYGEGYVGLFPDPNNMALILAEDSDESRRWRSRLIARMHDVSAFMKTLKQRFSWWFNRTHKRFGTLWAERFKSVLIEDDALTLAVVCAYIDLNPVRAGIVADPADYRWSSYGEAMGGEQRAQASIASALHRSSWAEAADDYRMVLFGKAANGRANEQAGLSRDRVVAVLNAGGKVPMEQLLRCRLRYMTQGAILGSEDFVREMGATISPVGASQKKALGRIPTADMTAPTAWRKLQKAPVS